MTYFCQFSNIVPSCNFPKVAKIYWFRGQTSWTLSHKLTPWSKKPVFKRAISMMDEFSVFPITSEWKFAVFSCPMSREAATTPYNSVTKSFTSHCHLHTYTIIKSKARHCHKNQKNALCCQNKSQRFFRVFGAKKSFESNLKMSPVVFF